MCRGVKLHHHATVFRNANTWRQLYVEVWGWLTKFIKYNNFSWIPEV